MFNSNFVGRLGRFDSESESGCGLSWPRNNGPVAVEERSPEKTKSTGGGVAARITYTVIYMNVYNIYI